MVEYLPLPYTITIKRLWWHERGLQQTASGYGRKLTTEYLVTVPGERARRVYAVCFSNVASFYVIRNGSQVFLRDSDLQNEIEKTKGVRK